MMATVSMILSIMDQGITKVQDTTDLAYCGRASEGEELTIEAATTKYKMECRICPWLSCDTTSYLLENVDLELTYWVPDGQLIIDDP